MADQQKEDLKQYARAAVISGLALFGLVVYGLVRFSQVGQVDLFLIYFVSIGLMWIVMSLDRICTGLEAKVNAKNQDSH